MKTIMAESCGKLNNSNSPCDTRLAQPHGMWYCPCKTTYHAAYKGHFDCLKFFVKNNYPFATDTTWAAAYHDQQPCSTSCDLHGCRHMKCLDFIFTECSHVETFEKSGIENSMKYDFMKTMNDYIISKKEEWIWFGNRDNNIKG